MRSSASASGQTRRRRHAACRLRHQSSRSTEDPDGAIPLVVRDRSWQLIFLAMIVVALALFARRAAYLVRLLLTGKPTVRWDAVPARLRGVMVYVLGQLRLISGDFAPGVMHAVIFWGFIVLTLGTVEYFGRGFVEWFGLPFLSDTPGYLILQDVFSVAVIRPSGTRRSAGWSRARGGSRSRPRAWSSWLSSSASWSRTSPRTPAASRLPPPPTTTGPSRPARSPAFRSALAGGADRCLPRLVVAARGPAAGLPGLAAVLEAPARARRAVQRVLRALCRPRAGSPRRTSRTPRRSGPGR